MTNYFQLPTDVPWALYRADKVVASGTGVGALRVAIEAAFHVRRRRMATTGLHALAFRVRDDSRSVVQVWVCDDDSLHGLWESASAHAPQGTEVELAHADPFLANGPGPFAGKQVVLDKLHTLELSALEGRNALSLGGVDEKGVRKLLDRIADHLHEVSNQVAALPQPVVVDRVSYALGRLDVTAPQRIWLQVDADSRTEDRDEPFPVSHDSVTWSSESIGGQEVPYVREDIAHGFLLPMATAPKDGTPVLLKFKSVEALPERLEAMADRWFVGANRGDSTEWGFAAPVGYGGIASERLAGWTPIRDEIHPCGVTHGLQAACMSVPRTAADAFLDFFRERGEALFAEFGMEAVDLFNAAQSERRAQAEPAGQYSPWELAMAVRKESAGGERMTMTQLDTIADLLDVYPVWPRASESEQQSGWTWSFRWMERLRETMGEGEGCTPSIEDIDALLSVLAGLPRAAVVAGD